MTSPEIACPGCTYVAASRSALGGHVTRQHHEERTALLLAAYTDVRRPTECWPWTGTVDDGGYAVLVVDRQQRRVSRMALGLRPGDDRQACHRCDNPPCVNPAHLYAGTAAENQHDKRRKGRAARGEENGGGGKLTAADVVAIRASEAGSSELGQQYGVSASMVRRIRSRRAWSHVP